MTTEPTTGPTTEPTTGPTGEPTTAEPSVQPSTEPARGLIVRVTDLFDHDPGPVRATLARRAPAGVHARVVRTGAGMLVTLEQRVPRHAVAGRARATRRLARLLTDVQTELDTSGR